MLYLLCEFVVETYYIAYAILFFVFSDLIIQFRFNKNYIGVNEIMYNSQTSNLFDRSIYDNMIYPKFEYPTKKLMILVNELESTSLISNERDLFSKKPGDFGGRFFGGEKQKILLIRSIVNKKSLILFDEINSSLDFHTRLNFIKIIDKYFNDSTIIIVTHENENFIYDEIINIQKI